MKISLIEPRELDATAIASWRKLQRENPVLSSPYFSPEFTLAMAGVKSDVRVAVLESDGAVVGWFPFQRDAHGEARAVGELLSDHHGVIAAAGTTWDWQELLAAAKIAHWRFDHLAASQLPSTAMVQRLTTSPAIDLAHGYAGFRESREKEGSRQLVELDRKARKLAREVGPVRFIDRCDDRAVLERVFAWKSEQCRSTGAPDFFTWGWPRALVERIAHTDEATFGGVVSALYAGDTLVAAHMGMRNDTTWHWWFPVYDHAYAKCSPGALLLLRVLEAASADGATLLDLGKGDEEYKSRFADVQLPLAEGFVGRPSLLNTARGAQLQLSSWLRRSPLLDPIRPAVRQLRRWSSPLG